MALVMGPDIPLEIRALGIIAPAETREGDRFAIVQCVAGRPSIEAPHRVVDAGST